VVVLFLVLDDRDLLPYGQLILAECRVQTVDERGKRVIFGREPALVAGLVKAVIALAVAFGLAWTNEQVSLVNAVVAALLGVYVAWATKDTLASAILALVDAVLSLLIGFGLNLSTNQTAAVIAVVTVVISMFNRTQTSPAASAQRGFSSGVRAP